MLYLALYPLHSGHPVFNVLRYETFRSVLAGLTALALSLAMGPSLIERFRAAHFGQTIRDVVPQTHQTKAGTPISPAQRNGWPATAACCAGAFPGC
jgi:phospho-N-acetylmuramoyl-pentapeptide-transferase